VRVVKFVKLSGCQHRRTISPDSTHKPGKDNSKAHKKKMAGDYSRRDTPAKRIGRRSVLGGMPAGAASIAGLDRRAHAADANLERCVTQLDMRGILLYSNLAGHWPDEKPFRWVFRRAVELGLPILLHPAKPTTTEQVKGYNLTSTLGNMFENTIALSRIVMSGILEEHPDLKLVCPHLGGTLPYISGRLDHQVTVLGRSNQQLQKTPSNCPIGLVWGIPRVLAGRPCSQIDLVVLLPCVDGNRRLSARHLAKIHPDAGTVFFVEHELSVPRAAQANADGRRIGHLGRPLAGIGESIVADKVLAEAMLVAKERRTGLDPVADLHVAMGVRSGAAFVGGRQQVSPNVGHAAGHGRMPQPLTRQFGAVVLVGPLAGLAQAKTVLLERRLPSSVPERLDVPVVKRPVAGIAQVVAAQPGRVNRWEVSRWGRMAG